MLILVKKKSATKRPRPGYFDYGTAPDAVSEKPIEVVDTGIW